MNHVIFHLSTPLTEGRTGATSRFVIPADLVAGGYRAIVIHLQVVKVTVGVVLQVEGVKRQPDQIARSNTDVPSAICAMGVGGRVSRASDDA